MGIRTLVVAFAVTVRNYRLLVVRHLLKGSFQFWLRERDQTFDNPSWAVKPLRLRPVPVPACNVQVSTRFVCDQAHEGLQRARQHQRQRQHADNVEVHVNVNINAVQVSDVSLAAVFKTIRQSTPSPSLLISSRSICRQCLTPAWNQITACQYLSPGKLFLF